MDTNILDHVRKLHFVGIGGSGMCPMAEILHHKGYELTGSDINESDTLERIRSYGIPVAIGRKILAMRSAWFTRRLASRTTPSWWLPGKRAFPLWSAL